MAVENNNEQVNEEVTNIDEGQAKANSTVESLKTDEPKEVDSKHIPYDRFKAKVDEANALKEKLAEFEEAKAEAERIKLEEQNEYKTLYEQALQQAEQAKAEALGTKKSALLSAAGYSEEQVGLLTKLVEGETDEEIAESIKHLQAAIPAQDKYGDPSAFNGEKAKPKTVDGEEVGRNAVSRVLHKIRL